MVRLSSLVALSLLGLSDAAACTSCTGEKAVSPRCRSREVAHRRDFFYIGGRSVPSPPGTGVVDQLYVEKLSPVGADAGTEDAKPIVFVHGGGTSGVSWLNKPDGKAGWASHFLQRGHTVYLVDSTGVGRTTSNDFGSVAMVAGMSSMVVEMGFTAVKDYNMYPQSQLHTQWPGTGRSGDAVFDQFHKAFLPINNNFVGYEKAMRAAGCELLTLIGEKTYLVSHSMGARATLLMSNDCPDLVAGNINVEGSTIPFWSYAFGLGGSPTNAWGFTNTPVDYDPPVSDPATELKTVSVGNETLALRNCFRQQEPARKLPKIASVPYLMVTGEASVHITYDHCVVDYLAQVGGDPEWIKLGELGIKGNGHFMHLEKNSDEIAEVVSGWIAKTDKA